MEKEEDEFQRLYEYNDDEDDSGDGGGDEEGRKDNPRYRSWLQMYHPEMLQLDSPLPSSYQPAVKQSSLGHFLVCPDPYPIYCELIQHVLSTLMDRVL